jgi:transcriptional regulator GlxA family with amidase domain
LARRRSWPGRARFVDGDGRARDRDDGAVPLTTQLPVARHLLRARDLADRCYAEPLGVADLARAAGLSPAHFSDRFAAAFGVRPHAYLLTRRLERAAALLRHTDHSVARVCTEVGLSSVGSFTVSFRRAFGRTPTAYRAAFPPAHVHALVPGCVVRFHGRPRNRSSGEDPAPPAS